MKKSVVLDIQVAKADLIDGLIKGIDVIRAFSGETVQLSATDVADKIRLARSAARRYLPTSTASTRSAC